MLNYRSGGAIHTQKPQCSSYGSHSAVTF